MTSTQFASIARARVILASCTSKRATFGRNRRSSPVRRLEINYRIGRAGRPSLATTRELHQTYLTNCWNSLIEYPFYKASENHWAIRGDGSRWECDDAPYQTGARDRFTTVHQIWFKQPPLTPIPSASWHAFVEACLSESGAEGTGECTEWASGNNYGTMPNWDTSLVEDMSGYDWKCLSRLWR